MSIDCAYKRGMLLSFGPPPFRDSGSELTTLIPVGRRGGCCASAMDVIAGNRLIRVAEVIRQRDSDIAVSIDDARRAAC